ncbi:MAG TPA: ferric reductase-like transmembrane domain-containing protein [Candidatus Saccharimonadia bacterium]|nr:ferric reductase-like transmembrane domain-containing protein [Candidatus Saccharimonadia bacterium]
MTYLQIHQLAVRYKQAIILAFHLTEIGLVVFTVVASVWGLLHPEVLPIFFEIGPKFGEAAAVMLSVTLIPGIIGRLRIFPLPRATMMMFRRQFGITTYLLVVTHSLFMYWLVSFVYGFTALSWLELFGISALAFGTPLIITSNDYSQRVLQKWWDRIHALVYLMLIAGMLHTLFFGVTTTSLLLTTIAVLEVISFLVQYIHAHTVPRG